MQKLQSQHGVNPLGGCLPVLVQVPVFIGLFHVLREFEPGQDRELLLRRARGRVVQRGQPVRRQARRLGDDAGASSSRRWARPSRSMLIVMIPLMIAAGIFTHITARHSVARQTEAQAANPQTAIMNKMMLYVFPIGVVVGAPFLPLAVLHLLGGEQPVDARPAVRRLQADRRRGERRRRRRPSASGRPAPRARARSRVAAEEAPPRRRRRPARKPTRPRRTLANDRVARPRSPTAPWRTAQGAKRTAKRHAGTRCERHGQPRRCGHDAAPARGGPTPGRPRAAPASGAEPHDHRRPRPTAGPAGAGTTRHPPTRERRRIVAKTAQDGPADSDRRAAGDVGRGPAGPRGRHRRRLPGAPARRARLRRRHRPRRRGRPGRREHRRRRGPRQAGRRPRSRAGGAAGADPAGRPAGVGQPQPADARHRRLAAGPPRGADRAGHAHREGGAGRPASRCGCGR